MNIILFINKYCINILLFIIIILLLLIYNKDDKYQISAFNISNGGFGVCILDKYTNEITMLVSKDVKSKFNIEDEFKYKIINDSLSVTAVKNSINNKQIN